MLKERLKVALKKIIQASLPPVLYSKLMSIREGSKPPVWREILAGPLGGRGFFVEQDGTGDKIVKGVYDPTLFNELEKVSIENGAVILDIGGHFGYHALSFASIFPQATVLCFEPVPSNIERIKVNLDRNQDLSERIVLKESAVSNKNGHIEMMLPPVKTGGLTSMGFMSGVGSRLHVARSKDYLGFISHRVRCLTLDSEVSGFGRVRLVKIDVEGAELDVLVGAKKIIARDSPIIFLEVHSVALAVDVLNELHSQKYGARVIEDQSRNRCVIMATPS